MTGVTRTRTFGDRTFGALRHSVYAWLVLGSFISQCGTWLHDTSLQYVIGQKTHDQFYVSLVIFCSFIPALPLGLIGGAIADRFDRRRVVTITQWVMLVCAGVLAILFALNVAPLWSMYVLTLGMGTALAIGGPAWFAFFPTLVPLDDLPSAISLNAIGFNMARAIGPTIGGFILGAFGAALAFGLNSLSFLAMLVPLTFLTFPASSRRSLDAHPPSGWSQIREGFTYVRRHRWLMTLLMTIVVQALFAAQIITLLTAFGGVDLHLSAKQVGFMWGALGLGGLIGALAASNVVGRVPRRIIVPAVIGGIGLSVVAVSLQNSYAGVLAAFFVVGVFYIGGMSSMNALVQMGVDDSVRGRVSSMWFTIFVGVFPIASLIWGWVASFTGTAFTYAVGGSVCAVYAVFLFAMPGLLRDDSP